MPFRWWICFVELEVFHWDFHRRALSLANDIEACCVDTYAHNHPETPRDHIVQGDIREVMDHLEELLKDRRVDIVVGGPPCQGFSMANRQRLIDDPRNYLYKSYLEVVKRVDPPFFVMENVKGMLSVADQVKEDFKGIGYTVECHILNAKDFGVPQNRERLIYIGNRMGVDNERIFEEIFERSKNIPEYVLGDAIYGLRPLQASRVKNSTEQGSEASGYRIEGSLSRESNEYIDYINQGRRCPLTLNHKARYNNDRDIEIFGRLYHTRETGRMILRLRILCLMLDAMGFLKTNISSLKKRKYVRRLQHI